MEFLGALWAEVETQRLTFLLPSVPGVASKTQEFQQFQQQLVFKDCLV